MTLHGGEVMVKRLNQPFAERQVLDVQQPDLQYEWDHQQQYPEQQILPSQHLVHSPPELPLVLKNLPPHCPTLFMESELNFCWSAVMCCFWINHIQAFSRGYQWNLSSTMKKRNIHNPSFRSTHSFNPVLHFLHKKNIKLPLISSSNGWQNT